jgi:hypothetical protein
VDEGEPLVCRSLMDQWVRGLMPNPVPHPQSLKLSAQSALLTAGSGFKSLTAHKIKAQTHLA